MKKKIYGKGEDKKMVAKKDAEGNVVRRGPKEMEIGDCVLGEVENGVEWLEKKSHGKVGSATVLLFQSVAPDPVEVVE